MQRVDIDNKEYLVGIDIGSSNVTMAVGTKNENGEISVLGVEVQKTEGCVKDGEIANHLLLGDAITRAKNALEADLNLRLNSAYVGISGRPVYCVRYEDYVDINEKTGCVTDLEMRELNARVEAVAPSGADVILDRIPLRYCIDERQEVKNPLGAYGHKLSFTYLYVMAGRHQIDRVNRALHRAGIKNNGLCINPTLLPDLLLTPEEKEEGVAIVDIGGDLTDIAVVREGKLHYFSSLPIGSSSINNDLHNALSIPKRDLDRIKHKYGSAVASAVPEDAAISIKTAGHAKRQILQRNIAEIAEERLKDIAQFVSRELKAAKFSTRIPCGVVLTGGATYLSNIEQLFASELNMEVRSSDILNGLSDESQEMICAKPQSAVIGLLLYGAKCKACDILQPKLPTEVTSFEPEDIIEQTDTEPKSVKPATPAKDSVQTPQVKEEKVVNGPVVKPVDKSDDEPVDKPVDEPGEKGTETKETVVKEPPRYAEKGPKRGLLGFLKGKIDALFEDDTYI